MIGARVAQFAILEELGGGGMGQVFRARDLRLERTVALKFLHSHLCDNQADKQRFLLEARAASNLDHPSICPVYAIDETAEGQLYIVMACYEGETLKQRILRGPVAPGEATGIAIAIAAGLAAAHRRGLVHRDIKPANVLLAIGAGVKLLDFGLAKLRSSRQALTRPGDLVGTPAYMSPEQAWGEDLDHRTDLWSLGVVLYEMLCGRRPFQGNNELATLQAIVGATPQPLGHLVPGLPSGLIAVVSKALRREPGARYGNAEEMITDLRGVLEVLADDLTTTRSLEPLPPGSGGPSIAVLPFLPLGGDSEDESFADGLAEELINALCQVEGLRVAARTSAFSFKGSGLEAREAGRRLGVATVLEGSVRRAGERLRINAQLIDASDGSSLWSERFDRELGDVFAVQDEISAAIAQRLRRHLAGGPGPPPPPRRSTENFEAYELYLQGRFLWEKRDRAGMLKGLAAFQQAIEKDPAFAPAHAGIADVFALLGVWGHLAPREAFPQARAAARRALELEPGLAAAHASIGLVRAFFDWDWAGADRSFARSVELRSSYPRAHVWSAMARALRGQVGAARAAAKTALGLDPLSLMAGSLEGIIRYLEHDFEGAVGALRAALELAPDFHLALSFLGLAHAGAGHWRAAIEALEKAHRLSGSSLDTGYLGYALAGAGEHAAAREVLVALDRLGAQRYVSSYTRAPAHLALGEPETALTQLEHALAERSSFLVFLKTSAVFGPLRGEPRFAAILAEMEIGS